MSALAPLVPAERWDGVRVGIRNTALAEYVNIDPTPTGECLVTYVWSDGQSRGIWYGSRSDADEHLASMGFVLPSPWVEAA